MRGHAPFDALFLGMPNYYFCYFTYAYGITPPRLPFLRLLTPADELCEWDTLSLTKNVFLVEMPPH